MQELEMKSMIQDYLDAFHQRDLARCLNFYDENAKINFATGVYEGRPAIEGWHKDRFEANLQVLQLEKIAVRGETVVVDATVTSKRLQKWRINSLAGKASVLVRNGKIKEIRFDLRMYNPLEAWE